MDFIAPLACNQFEEDWRAAFSDLGEVVLPVKPHGPRRYISWGNQYWEAMERGHAVDVPACPDKNEMPGIEPVPCGRGVGEECSTFALCDSTGCGHDLFPAIACIQNRGLPAEGVISAVAPDGSFFIEAQYLPSHSDTAVVYGTSFETIPEDLLADTMVPISRHLVAYAVTSDPYAEPELLNVMIAYEEADLESAGVQDEQSLRVYWDTGLTEGQFIASVVDTHLNEVSFTISNGGIGGIYGEGASPVPQASQGGYVLYAASPNPFNPQATISFDLPSEMAVNLRVYDVSGRLVDVLVNGEVAQQGRNEVIWRGRDLSGRQCPSGTYFYRLEAGGYSETKRMTLLK